MKIKELYDCLIKKKYLGHALALDTFGVNPRADVTKDLIENLNDRVKNVATALDEWRYDNEDQFDEDSEDFDNWKGDTLEIQESLQDEEVTLEDLKEWGYY